MLEVSHLNFSYDKLNVINDLTLRVSEGSIVSIVGKRLSGKSTLFKIISGRERISSGKVIYCGKDITADNFCNYRGRDIFCVDRYKGLFLGLTVEENIILGAWHIKDKNLLRKNFLDVLDIAPYMEKYSHIKAGNLCSGEKMLVSIAMAIISKPNLIVIDEPTFGFYPVFTEKILDLLYKTNKNFGTTFLLMQREVDMAVRISKWIYQFDAGEIVKQGDSKSFEKFDIKY